MPLTNQGFVRVLDHFPVTTEHDQFTVVVEEFVGSDVLRLDKFLHEVTKKKQALRIDEVATVVRRAVEALKQFHDCKAGNAYGLLTPKHLYYDHRGQKLLLPAVGVSNFLWAAMGWERLSTWQDEGPNLASYVAPEAGRRADRDGEDRPVHAGTARVRDARRTAALRDPADVGCSAEGRVLG